MEFWFGWHSLDDDAELVSFSHSINVPIDYCIMRDLEIVSHLTRIDQVK